MATLGEMNFKVGTEVDSKAIQDLEKRLVDLTKNQSVKIKAELDFAGLNMGVKKLDETKIKLEEIDKVIRDLGQSKFKDSSLKSLNPEVSTLVKNIQKLRDNTKGEARDTEFIKGIISGLDNLSERYKRTKLEMSNFSSDILGGNPRGFLKTSLSGVENAFSEYIPKVRSELKKLLSGTSRTTDGLAEAMSMKLTKKKGLSEALMFDQAIKEAERARARVDELNKQTGRTSNIIGNGLRNAMTVSDFEIPKVYIKELYPTQAAVNGFISSLRERIEEVFKGKPLEIPVKAMIITGSDAKDALRKAYESTVDNLVTYMANKFSTISGLALKKATEAPSTRMADSPKTLGEMSKTESDAQKKLLERSAAIKDTHKEILDLIGDSNKRLGKSTRSEIQAIISGQKLRLENAGQRISVMPDDVRIDFVDNIEAIDKYIGHLNRLSKMIDNFGKSGNKKEDIAKHLTVFSKPMDKELAGLSKSSSGDLTAYNEASNGITRMKNAADEGVKSLLDLHAALSSGKTSFQTLGNALDGLRSIFELAGKAGIGGKEFKESLNTLEKLRDSYNGLLPLKGKARDIAFGSVFDQNYKDKLSSVVKFANSIMENPILETHSRGDKVGSQVSRNIEGMTINASLVNLNVPGVNAVSYSSAGRGGRVKGRGTQTSDSIATFLSRGEYVVNAFSTKDYEPILALMNKIRGGSADIKMIESALSGLSKAYPDNAAFSSSLEKISRGARLTIGDFAALGIELQKVLGLEMQLEKHQGGGKSGSGSTSISQEALAINNLGLEIESCDKKLKSLNSNLSRSKEGSAAFNRNVEEINKITAQKTALVNEKALRTRLSNEDSVALATMLSNIKSSVGAAKNTPAFDVLKEQERVISDVINLRKIDVEAIKNEEEAQQKINRALTEYRQKVRDLQERSYTLEKRGKSNVGTQREIGIYQGMIRHYEGMMKSNLDTDQMNAALANMSNFDDFMRKHGRRRFNLMNQNGDQSLREEKATWKAIEDNYNTQRKLREQSTKDAKKESDAMDALKNKYIELSGAFRIMREQERGGLFGKNMTSAQQGMISLMREVKNVISSGDYAKAMDRAFSSSIQSRQREYAQMVSLQRQINANSRNDRPADTVYMESWLQGRIDKVVDSYNLIKQASMQPQYRGTKTDDALQKLIDQYRELIILQQALKRGSIFDSKSKSFVNFGASEFIAATKDLRTRGTVSRTIETAQSLKFAQGRDNTIARNARKQFDDEVRYVQDKLAQMNQYYLSLLAKRKTGEIGGAGVDAGIKDLKNLIRYMKYVQGSPSLLHGFVSGNVFGSSIASIRGQIDRQAIANRQQAKIDADNTSTYRTLENVIGNVEGKISSLRVLWDRLNKEGKDSSFVAREITRWQTYLSSLTAGRTSVSAASAALSGYKNAIRSMEEETGKAINTQNAFNRQQAANAKNANSATTDYERTMQKMRNAYKSAEIAWNKIDFLQSIGVDGQKLRDAKTQVDMLYRSLGSAIATGNIRIGKDILYGNSRQDSFAMQMKNVGELMFENGKLKGIDGKNISKVANAYSRLKTMLDNAVVDRDVLAVQGKGTAKMDAYISSLKSYMATLSGVGTDASKAKAAIASLDSEMRRLNKEGKSARKLQVVDNNDIETQRRNTERLNAIVSTTKDSLNRLKEERRIAAADGKDVSNLDAVIKKYEDYINVLNKASKSTSMTAAQVRVSGMASHYLGSQAIIARMMDKSFNLDSISGKNAGDKIRKMMAALDLEIKKLDNKFVKGTKIKIDNSDAKKKIEYLKSMLSGFDSLSGKQRKVALETEIRRGTFSNGLAEARMMAGRNYETAARFSKQQKDISSELMSQSRLSQELGNMIANMFSIYTLRNFFRNLVQIGGEMQKQHIALQSILGDEARANSLFSELKGLAVNSPFKFGQLASYSKQLAAFSIPYDEMYDTTKRLADISAGLGVDMSRIILAYGQVRSAAFLRGQEVRQFTEAGIPLLDKLADKFSAIEGRAISAGEVFDRISKREVSFDMVKDVLWGLTDEGGQFYNMQDKLIDSLSGKMTKLADQYEIALADIAEENKDIIGGVIDGLVSMTSHLGSAIKVGAGMFAMFTAFKAATFVGGIVELVKWTRDFTIAEISTISATNLAQVSMVKLSKAIKSVQLAFSSLGKAGWVGIILSALAAIGLYVYNAKVEAEKLKKEFDKLGDETVKKTQKTSSGYAELVEELSKTTRGTKEYADIINKINSTYGEYISHIYGEAEAYDLVADSVQNVTDAIQKRYANEQYEKGVVKLNEKYDPLLSEAKNSVINDATSLAAKTIRDINGNSITTERLKIVFGQIVEKLKKDITPEVYKDSSKLVEFIKNTVDSVAQMAGIDTGTLNYEYFNRKLGNGSRATRNILRDVFFGADSMGGYVAELAYLQSTMSGFDPDALYGDKIKEINTKYDLAQSKIGANDRTARLKKEEERYEEILKELSDRGVTSGQRIYKEYKSKLEDIQKQLQKFVITANNIVGERFQDLLPGKNDVGDFMGYIKRLAEVYKNTVTEIGELEKIDSGKQSSEDTKGRLERDRNRKNVLDRLADAYGINWADWGGKGTSKKTESELKALSARLDLYKKVEELRDKAIQHGSSVSSAWDFVKTNDDGAFNALSELEKWQNAQAFTYEDFLKKNEDFRKELRKKLGASSKMKDEDLYKMLVSALNWIEDVNFKNIDKEVDKSIASFNQEIDATMKKWSFYKTVRDSTGNALKAAKLAFGDSSKMFESEFSLLYSEFSKRVSGTILSASNWQSLVGLNESDVAEYVYGKSYDETNPKHKQNVKEIIDIASKLKSAQDSQTEEFRAAISDAINLYPDVIKYGMERNSIEEEYIRLIKLAKTEEEKELLGFRKNSKMVELDIKEFKSNPLNSYALSNLSNLTKRELKDLESAIKDKFGEDVPETLKKAMKEVYEWRDNIFNEKSSREFLGGITKTLSDLSTAKSEYDAALKNRDLLEGNYYGLLSDPYTTEEQIADAKQEFSDADLALSNAEDNLVRCTENVRKSISSLQNNIQALGSTISNIGGKIGGDLGGAISSFGGAIGSISGIYDSVSKGGMNAVGGYVQAVLSIYDVSKSLSDAVSNMAHDHYERQAERAMEVNRMADAMYEYVKAVDEANYKNKTWFASTPFMKIPMLSKKLTKAEENYKRVANERQAAYVPEQHGGWGNYFVAGLVAAAAAATAYFTGGYSIIGASGAMAALVGEGAAITATGIAISTAAGAAAAGLYAGAEAVYNAFNYADGTANAWANLWIETQSKSNGFWGLGWWGSRDQEVESLQGWLNDVGKITKAYSDTIGSINQEVEMFKIFAKGTSVESFSGLVASLVNAPMMDLRHALDMFDIGFSDFDDKLKIAKEIYILGIETTDLIIENEYGIASLNVELAEAILNNETIAGKLQGNAKETLQNLVNGQKEINDALDEMKQIMADSASPLVDNMVDAIWDWFDNGTNALDAFKNKASDTFRDIASQMVKTLLLGSTFDQFSNELVAIARKYGADKDGGVADAEKTMASKMADAAGRLLKEFEVSSEAAETFLKFFDQEIKNAGYDNGLTSSNSSSLSSGIKSITEETADLLAAYLNAIRADVSIERSLFEQLIDYHLPLIENLLGGSEPVEEKPVEDITFEEVADKPNATNDNPIEDFIDKIPDENPFDDLINKKPIRRDLEEVVPYENPNLLMLDSEVLPLNWFMAMSASPLEEDSGSLMEQIAYTQIPMLNATASAQLAQLNMQTEYLRQIQECTSVNMEALEQVRSDLHSVIYGANKINV